MSGLEVCIIDRELEPLLLSCVESGPENSPTSSSARVVDEDSNTAISLVVPEAISADVVISACAEVSVATTVVKYGEVDCI